ncbi:uncharacterized protein K02A2.6-like [Galendromus occidentalis]|uniref:Uncharacterized protein K02A2.6-like n=1 Tax=Galendromus occidentalis TaxID=34638 RepID=A0AAJ7L3D4_9ACAR|nr:uncharacterized protein K02A2.6-like [Galendromus occidentalis]
MLQKARFLVFWPSIGADLREILDKCIPRRSRDRANTPLPLKPTAAPPHPWHTVGLDFIHHNNDTHLFIIDYFSKDFLIKKMTTTTATCVIKVLGEWWLLHCYPTVLVSDNGPPYASKGFEDQLKKWDIKRQPISPGHSQANGMVERHTQIIKSTIAKAQMSGADVMEALLTLRTSPLADGSSPAQISMGRTLRSSIPTSNRQVEAPIKNVWEIRKRTLGDAATIARAHFDKRARELPPLQPNQKVWVQIKTRLWKKGTVGRVLHDRAYEVKMSDGAIFRRNRTASRPDFANDARPNPSATPENVARPRDPMLSTTMTIPAEEQPSNPKAAEHDSSYTSTDSESEQSFNSAAQNSSDSSTATIQDPDTDLDAASNNEPSRAPENAAQSRYGRT